MAMKKCHFAYNEEKRVVGVDDDPGKKTGYTCIGCGAPLVPVRGKIRDHHFRHKDSCKDPEGYVHKLGKRMLIERFEESESFVVGVEKRNSCDKKETCKMAKELCQSSTFVDPIDMKKIYTRCEEEKEYKGFRADVMLDSDDRERRPPLFLEIAVSHKCEPKKIYSKIKIIEFDVQNEFEAFALKTCPIVWPENYDESTAKIRFYNFERKASSPKHELKKIALKKDGTIDRENNSVVCGEWENHSEENVIEVVATKEDRLAYILTILGNVTGKGLWQCGCCRHYHSCKISKFTITDRNTGQRQLIGWSAISPQDWPQICGRYTLDIPLCERSVRSDVYDSWIRPDDEIEKE